MDIAIAIAVVFAIIVTLPVLKVLFPSFKAGALYLKDTSETYAGVQILKNAKVRSEASKDLPAPTISSEDFLKLVSGQQ